MSMNIRRVPKEDIVEKLQRVLPVGLAAIGTAIGSPELSMIATTFAGAIGPSLDGRRDQFLEMLGTEVYYLKDEVISKIFESEEFKTQVVEATRIATKTHIEEKHRLLRNVVINGVVQSVDEIFKHRCLRLIEDLDPQHLVLLDMFRDPREFMKASTIDWDPRIMATSFESLFQKIIDDYNEDRKNHYLLLLSDLMEKHLIQARGFTASDANILSAGTLNDVMIAPLGSDFMLFIEDRPREGP